MKTAVYMRSLNGFQHAALYKLYPPMGGTEYVVVSAIWGGLVELAELPPEALIFPATGAGEISSWTEIGGLRGVTSHIEALENFGYKWATVPPEWNLNQEEK